MKPAILLTGGAGYIGSHTALAVAQQGFLPIVLDSFVHNQQFNVPWAKVIKNNFADRATLKAIFSEYTIQAVMHFAACIEVGESVTDPASFYENNVSNTITLLQEMNQHHIKNFIFSSSCAVYGNPQSLPLSEEHPKNPVSPYGKTKLMVETILQDFAHAYGLNFVCLRYFNAAGALPEQRLGEQHTPETHIIPLLLNAAQHSKPFTIFGADYDTPDGTAIRDYLHVRDIAQAHVKALTHLNRGHPSDYFNLGTGKGFSVQQIVDAVQKITRTKLLITQGKRRTGDPAILVADPGKAEAILQFKPQFSDLEFIISSAAAFAQQMQLDKNSPLIELA